MAVREIDEGEATEWLKVHAAAANVLVGRSEALTAAARQVEHDMDVLGVTAIEDRLQDDVPATIVTLREAQLKLWVLTGDMMLTAINIGYSSRMLSPGQTLLQYE